MGKEKTVGILGGMGPYAALEFFKEILFRTPAKKDWEHIRLIIDNNVKIPSRTRAILYNEQSPAPSIIESINNLASIGADLVAVPCNSAHYFYNEVIPHISIPWINIIEVTADKIKELRLKKPLIIGGYVTTTQKLYDVHIENPVYLKRKENEFIEAIIEEIKLNVKLSSNSRQKLLKVLKDQSPLYDSILLACTEFSLIAKDLKSLDSPIIDSTSEYAEKIVKLAKN